VSLDDHRLFCGDLGNEVSEQLLTKVFERYPSFARAKVIRDKRTGKSKGFGFVSFTVLGDMISALKEQDGKYVGNRPIRLKKSEWDKRDASADKTWTAKHNQFGNQVTAGNRKLHLY
jgi:RNA recognition motif-containing protein